MSKMHFKVHISPCPNDTFMFEAMLNGRVDTEGLSFEPCFADIEQLNEGVISGVPEISKISYAVLDCVYDKYVVLDSGSAVGRGNGPLLVSKGGADASDPSLKVAVPGINTTANLLMQRLFPQLTDRSPVLFSEIADAVAGGRFDAGVLIHEGRFTYADKGLHLVTDLGKMWEDNMSMPLPLGGIVVLRKLSYDVRVVIGSILRRSVEFAMRNPAVSRPFVREHAQELSDSVIDSHIKLFVNEFSVSLSKQGREAVSALTGLPCEKIF